MNMTVREFILKHKYDEDYKGVWLCPRQVNNARITPIPYLCSFDAVSESGVPKEVIDREIVKVWKEDGKYCIIWENN